VTHEAAEGRGSFLSGALSATPLADEYRRIQSAFQPGARAAFDRDAHPPELVERARTWWLQMMRTEYESASTFVEMAVALRTINDPIDVQAVALRMAQDELRHAEISAGVVTALGAEARISPAPNRRTAPHPDCGPDEAVLRAVIFGCCLSETVNAARLAKRYAETADPFIKEAFRLLLADERLHAQFGYYYLESRREWLRDRLEVRRSLARYLRFAFAALERYMGVVPVGARPPDEAERAIGLPDLTDLSQTFQETVLNACIPGLERFGIEAAPAWRERTTEPPARERENPGA
jgi:hypothetical protein